jgi:tripartite-type tricarboxylate transporter receptor subunit TctC
MERKNLLFMTIFLFLCLLITGGCSNLQDKELMSKPQYPNKPITVIVPFSVGGGLDLAARSLEKLAPKYLGQPLVIVNRPGGAGAIGWNELSGANPDGYTLGITGMDMLLLPSYGPTKYDYPTALDPLAQVASLPMVMAVQSEQPWQTVEDLIEYAKKHPGQLKFGHGGVGSFPHLLGEMFGQAAGITIEQVPFTGSGEGTANLLGGHVQIIFVNPMAVKEHVKNGTIRVLAVTSEQRMSDPVFAKVPTFKESGLDIALSNWYGIAAPKEMPVEVKNRLTEGFKQIIMDPEFINNIKNVGLQVDYLGSKESQDKWLSNNETLNKILKETDVLDKIKAQKK